jgi:hypothetical protein
MIEQSIEAMEMGGSIYSGDKSKLDESANAFKAKQAEHERKVAELLGADGAAQFKDYQKTLGDRMALGQLRERLGGVNALQSQQEEALLKIMGEERAKGPFIKLTDQGDPAGAMKEMGSPDALEKFTASQTDLNSRVAMRAMSVLTPSQYTQFQEFQKQQVEMQKLGLKMAGQLMSPQKSGSSGQ